ncbi:MAG: alpha/beta hydrolase [Planctomycetes bacterium]|nr:alpha/beta hydrolase [Planctomycetota bacterium]
MLIRPPVESLVGAVSCDIVRLELAGGYLGYGRFYEAAEARRGVVYLHGIQSHGGWFLGSCDFLRGEGNAVLAMDRRGSGLNEQERGHCDGAGQLLEDVDRSVEWLRSKYGFDRVDLVAVSWGGKLALVYAGRYPEKVRSVVLVAPGLCVQVDISLREKIAVGAHGLVKPRKLHEIPLNDPELFTQAQEMIKFIEGDPLKLTEGTARFFVTSRHLDWSVRKIVSELKVPVYLFLAERDRIIDNAATIKLLEGVLRPTSQANDPWRMYEGACHTLEFEPGRQVFFEDLASCLGQETEGEMVV